MGRVPGDTEDEFVRLSVLDARAAYFLEVDTPQPLRVQGEERKSQQVRFDLHDGTRGCRAVRRDVRLGWGRWRGSYGVHDGTNGLGHYAPKILRKKPFFGFLLSPAEFDTSSGSERVCASTGLPLGSASRCWSSFIKT